MAQGNTGNTKEYAQCLAFAYFAVHKYPTNNEDQEDHKLSFYKLFITSSDRKKFNIVKLNPRAYRSNLGNRFKYIKTTKDLKTTINTKGNLVAHTTTQKVYDVALELYKSKTIGQNWENYEFLDQTDSFMQTVKDAALDRIKTVFQITFKLDMLASFDMFIVKKQKKQIILDEINKYIINASDSQILANYSKNQHTYRTILNRHFSSGKISNSRSLVAVSLKLPTTVEQTKHINIVGTVNVKKEISDYIDPYTKFLAMAGDATPAQLKLLIENLIKIEYSQFRVSPSLLSWELPVTFRYKVAAQKVFGRDVESLSDINYKIVFTAQGYSAGWNAKVVQGHQGKPYVGGGGVATFEHFYEQYKEYSTVIQKLVHMRAKAFNYALTGNQSGSIDMRGFSQELKNLHKKATQDLLTKKILYTVNQSKNLTKFFKVFDQETGRVNTITAYQVALINLVRKQISPSIKISDKYANFTMTEMIPNPEKRTSKDKEKIQVERPAKPREIDDRIEAHYTHAQLAWFTFIGGKKFEAYFKQRMFLTIYGAVSKKGYKIFDYDKNLTTIKSAIAKQVQGKVAAFDSAPHLLLS